MGENSGIQWTTHTFNPWVGCQKVSPGCTNCYAEVYDKRVGGAKLPDGTKSLRWGPKAPRVRTAADNWKKPLAWNRAAEAAGERHRVFCASLADVFEDRPELVPWRAELFDLIQRTESLDWLVLTKRPENITRLWPTTTLPTGARCYRPGSDFWPNVWLGTTVEDQQRANERIPALLEVPAVVRFISCEPLLERVNLRHIVLVPEDPPYGPEVALNALTGNVIGPDDMGPRIDWVIIGGESGPGARPFAIDWARDLLEQCRRHGTAPFVKQLGAVPCISLERLRTHGAFEHTMQQDPRPTAVPEGTVRAWLSDSAGGDMAEWPADLRVREFPTAPSKP